MPWTSDALAGFTSAPDAWLPVPETHHALSVAVQEQDPLSCLTIARRLLGLRRDSPVLRLGGLEVFEASSSLIGFRRAWGEEALDCVFSIGTEGGEVDLPGGGGDTLFLHRAERTPRGVRLSPFSAAIMRAGATKAVG